MAAKYSLPDPDFDMPNLVDSRYHTVHEFQNLDIIQNFNIFHANANGLEGKFDILHTFLASSKAVMDVIAVTETSENNDDSFQNNEKLDGFKVFHTPTFSTEGGVALYVNSSFDSFERNDFKVQNSDFEGARVEIKNSNSKKIVCGSVYCHPRDNNEKINDFLNYLELCLKSVSNENKEVYVFGDFNIDLLKLDAKTSY